MHWQILLITVDSLITVCLMYEEKKKQKMVHFYGEELTHNMQINENILCIFYFKRLQGI